MINRVSAKPEISEKLKAKQYGAAVSLRRIIVAIILKSVVCGME